MYCLLALYIKNDSGLFRDLNPIFVFLFTLITRYIFKVAVTEEEGGKRLAYMIANTELEKVNGAYYSGKPGVNEFKPIPPSAEASDVTKGKMLWELTEKLIKKNI